jgi:hypothetical protein
MTLGVCWALLVTVNSIKKTHVNKILRVRIMWGMSQIKSSLLIPGERKLIRQIAREQRDYLDSVDMRVCFAIAFARDGWLTGHRLLRFWDTGALLVR